MTILNEQGVRYSHLRVNPEQIEVTYCKRYLPTDETITGTVYVDSLMYFYKLLSIWNSKSSKWKLYV